MSDVSVWSILSLGSLDLCASSTLTPFLPLIAQNLGASALEVGLISTIYGTLQVLFAPIIGQLSDKYGRKRALQCGFLGSALTGLSVFTIASLSLPYYCLMFAVMPMAIFRHNQGALKSLMCDISVGKSGKNSGILGNVARWSVAAYVGTMIGPLLTSFVGESSAIAASLCTALYFCAAIVTTLITFPKATTKVEPTIVSNDDTKTASEAEKKSLLAMEDESSSSPKEEIDSQPTTVKETSSSTSSSQGWLQSITARFQFPNSRIRSLIIYHFIAYFALNLYRSGFVLILKHRFDISMSSLGYIFSYRGFVGLFVTLFITKQSSKRGKNERKAAKLLFQSTIILALAMILFGFSRSINHIAVVLILQESGESMFRTSFHALFGKELAPFGKTQTYMGLVDSLASVNRSVAPLVFGIIPENVRYRVTPVFAGALDLVLILFCNPVLMKLNSKTC